MNQFVQLQTLARGAFGSVLLVRDRQDETLRILKQTDMTRLPDSSHASLHNEVSDIMRLSHPHIVTYAGAFVDQLVLNLVVEFCEEGDVGTLITHRRTEGGSFSDEEASLIIAQCVSGLGYAHSNDVLHRDLRAENLLRSPTGSVKLGDFCPATIFTIATGRDFSVPQHGSGQSALPLHWAPEVCEGQSYNALADLWSVGVIYYSMLALRPPFQAFNRDTLVMKIVDTAPPPLPATCSDEARDVVRRLLQKKSLARPSCDQLMFTQPIARHIESAPFDAVRPRTQGPSGATPPRDSVDELLSTALPHQRPQRSQKPMWSLSDAPSLPGMRRTPSCPGDGFNRDMTREAATGQEPPEQSGSPIGCTAAGLSWQPPGRRKRRSAEDERPPPSPAALFVEDELPPPSPAAVTRRSALGRAGGVLASSTTAPADGCDPKAGSRMSPLGDRHIDSLMEELLQREKRLLESPT